MKNTTQQSHSSNSPPSRAPSRARSRPDVDGAPPEPDDGPPDDAAGVLETYMQSLSAAELRDLSRTFRKLAVKHIHGDAPTEADLLTSREFVQATAAAYRLAEAPVEVLAGLAHGLKRCADHRTSAGRGDTR